MLLRNNGVVFLSYSTLYIIIRVKVLAHKKERNKNKYGDFVVFRYEVRGAQTGEKLENEKMGCEVVLEE